MVPWFRLTPQFGSPTMCPAPRCVSLIFSHISAIWEASNPSSNGTNKTTRHEAMIPVFCSVSSLIPLQNPILPASDLVVGIPSAASGQNSAETRPLSPIPWRFVTICGDCSFWPTSCRHSGGSACSIPIGPTCGRFYDPNRDCSTAYSVSAMRWSSWWPSACRRWPREIESGSSPTRSTASPRCPRGSPWPSDPLSSAG